MTEKRFKLGYVCGDFGLIDDDEWIDLHSMSENSEKNVRICINKMNELADENEQLKQRIKELEKENVHYKAIFFEIVETALTDKNCRELYCKGILDIFDKANSLNQAREMINEFLE